MGPLSLGRCSVTQPLVNSPFLRLPYCTKKIKKNLKSDHSSLLSESHYYRLQYRPDEFAGFFQAVLRFSVAPKEQISILEQTKVNMSSVLRKGDCPYSYLVLCRTNRTDLNPRADKGRYVVVAQKRGLSLQLLGTMSHHQNRSQSQS